MWYLNKLIIILRCIYLYMYHSLDFAVQRLRSKLRDFVNVLVKYYRILYFSTSNFSATSIYLLFINIKLTKLKSKSSISYVNTLRFVSMSLCNKGIAK